MDKLRISTLAMCSLLSAGSIALPTTAYAFERLTMAEAEKRCFLRTARFATEGAGPSGRERSAFEIRSNYQRCIYGYTGQNPASVPKFGRN